MSCRPLRRVDWKAGQPQHGHEVVYSHSKETENARTSKSATAVCDSRVPEGTAGRKRACSSCLVGRNTRSQTTLTPH